MPDRQHDTLLRLPDVRARTKLSRATIYRKMAAGAFPPATPISKRMVAWYEADINAWVANPIGWRAAA